MPIDSQIRNIIKTNGHIKIDDMMREVLALNSDSYYKSIENVGEDGDFITSPEISQLFGEILALWAIEKWKQLGSPSSFSLVELGPGQGKLMQDLMRTAKLVPEFYKAAQIYLLEINPHFIKKQKKALNYHKKQANWITKVTQIPKAPMILIANEFFDALAIKQYIKVKNKWFELILVTDPLDGRIKHDKIELHKALQDHLLKEHTEAKDGAIIEESLDSLEIIRLLSNKLNKFGGVCLIIDYGYDIKTANRTSKQYNSTLQAIKNHQYHSIIDSLGESDLTAHVDFNALKKAMSEQGINGYKTFTQQDFLIKYGINFRLQSLKNNANQAERELLDKQVFRLTSEKQMGTLFKVLEIVKI